MSGILDMYMQDGILKNVEYVVEEVSWKKHSILMEFWSLTCYSNPL